MQDGAIGRMVRESAPARRNDKRHDGIGMRAESLATESIPEPGGALPARFADWFAARGWSPHHDHQLDILAAAAEGAHALLVAPTGGGKTLAGFLPSLIDIAESGATTACTRSTSRR